MWTVCITSIRHVLKLNGYGGPQAKVNGKSQCFKGWETLVSNIQRNGEDHGPKTKIPNNSQLPDYR